jgi:DNA-binding SARP family transcriptional activator
MAVPLAPSSPSKRRVLFAHNKEPRGRGPIDEHSMIASVPRLPPSLIRRPRLEDWFARFRGVPVRFLVAPAGFGKTTAILNYIRYSESNLLYASLPSCAAAADIWTAIGNAVRDERCTSLDDAVRALVERAPVELALDFVDVPSADAAIAVTELIEALPDDVSLLIACRSRVAIDVGQLVARGLATLCDAERLAFDASEIRHLAETCNVSFTHTDVVRMLDSSDGWPVVVSGAMRKAAEDGCDLSEAFENWRSRHGHFFNEFVSQALANASPDEAALVQRLMTGSACDDQAQLRGLEVAGLFVIHGSQGYRLLRTLSRANAHRRFSGNEVQQALPLQVRMFGRFQAEIDGHPIEWIRRRDQQIFKYVALKRSGTVSRAELIEAFWPDAEKHLVAQSLRTAYCNIRKAIAKIVGFDMVDAYFRANGEVSLNLDNVVVDVNRFVAHANDGDQQYDRNDWRAAYAHYRTAEQLYWGNLLVGDAAEPWFAGQTAMLEDRYVIVLERLAEIALELSDLGAAVNYARRVVDLRPGCESAQSVLALVVRQARLKKTTPMPLLFPLTATAAPIARQA